MKTFDRYKQNLKQIGNHIISYDTHVAEIKDGKLHKLKWNVRGMTSSPTTSKHINYVAKELGLTVIENGQYKDEHSLKETESDSLKERYFGILQTKL